MSTVVGNPVLEVNNQRCDETFSPSKSQTRYIVCHFVGSPCEFEATNRTTHNYDNPQTSWNVFGDATKPYNEDNLQDIKNVMIESITLDSHKSTYPSPCALNIDGIQGTEYSPAGEANNFIFIGPSSSQKPKVLFQNTGNMQLAAAFANDYPGLNRDNITTKGVMKLRGAEYYFVQKTHPIIRLLYNNQDLLGTEINNYDENEGWYRVSENVFHDSIESLNRDIFDQTPPFFDLSQLTVRLKPIDNRRWLDFPNVHTMKNEVEKKKLYHEYINTPVEITAKLKIVYTTCPQKE